MSSAPIVTPAIAADSLSNAPRGRMVALLMLVVALAHFNRVGMSVAGAERIIPQSGLSEVQMGQVYSAFLLCYTVVMLPAGLLLDRFGARRALMVLGFGSALFVTLTGCVGLAFHQAQDVWLGLLVVRSLLGVVSAPLHPAAARMVYQHAPAGARSSINGLVTCAACLGIASTYYGLGTLMDVTDWPIAFVICGGVTLFMACVWTLATRSSDASSAQSHMSEGTSLHVPSLLRVLGQRGVICVTLSYAALGYFQYLFFYWIEYFVKTIQHQDVNIARQYTTLIVLAMGAGMACGGRVTDLAPASWSPRLRRSLVPALGMFASGLVFELGLLSANPQATLAAFGLAAALLGACEGAFWTTVVELGGRFGGAAAGLMNTGGNAGGTLSPYLTPLLSAYFAKSFGDSAGWRLSLAVAGAVSVAGALLWWGVNPAPDVNPSKSRETSHEDHAR